MGNDRIDSDKMVIIGKASSLKDLPLLSKKSNRNFKSAGDLPTAVAECFHNSSFFSRCRSRFLFLIGKGSRYKMERDTGCSFFSRSSDQPPAQLLVSQPKEHTTPSPSNGSYQRINVKLKPKSASTPTRPQKFVKEKHNVEGTRSMNEDYSTVGPKELSSTEEEILLQQYSSLRQMASARRCCAHLRRIRESLLKKAKPKIRNGPPSPEQEKLRGFLLEIGFVRYYSSFNRNGYDLPTASHMDVLDLVAIGVHDPLHRMALKYELDQIRIPIKTPEIIPETTVIWLDALGLSEYIDNFQQNSFYCPLAAIELTKRDLQMIGIYMLGHRKKIILSLGGIKLSILRKDFPDHKVS